MTEIETFLEDMRLNNASPSTIYAYSRYLKDIYAGIAIDKLDLQAVRDFKARKSNLKASSLSYYLIALRSFLRWCIKNNISALNPELIDVPKQRDHKLVFLNKDEVIRLLKQPKNARDNAILQVLFSTGLRVSELVSLDKNQFSDTGEIVVIGKGGKRRLVFLAVKALNTLKYYLNTRKDTNPALFTSFYTDSRIKVRAIQLLVKKYAKKANLSNVTPHVLRHSMATDLLQQGADIRSIQEILGHKSIATTQIYTHVTSASLSNTFQKYHSNL